jgi:hypothetical protein
VSIAFVRHEVSVAAFLNGRALFYFNEMSIAAFEEKWFHILFVYFLVKTRTTQKGSPTGMVSHPLARVRNNIARSNHQFLFKTQMGTMHNDIDNLAIT